MHSIPAGLAAEQSSSAEPRRRYQGQKHTHTYIHTYICNIYIYICHGHPLCLCSMLLVFSHPLSLLTLGRSTYALLSIHVVHSPGIPHNAPCVETELARKEGDVDVAAVVALSRALSIYPVFSLSLPLNIYIQLASMVLPDEQLGHNVGNKKPWLCETQSQSTKATEEGTRKKERRGKKKKRKEMKAETTA